MAPTDNSIARLRWRCRRGTRELDLLLLRFLERDYPHLNARDQSLFRALLDEPDPDLYAWITGRAEPGNSEYLTIINPLRNSLEANANPFLAPVRIDGADATGFLHGQFTTDVAGLASGQAGLSAWCDPKGRVIAAFILARLDETFWLLLPGALKRAFIQRLKMYVLRAQVNIVDERVERACRARAGMPTGETSAIVPGLEAVQIHAVSRHDGLIFICYPAGVVTVLAVSADVAGLPASRPGTDRKAWETAFIRQGIPWLHPETGGRFLPQELNLERLDAVSFTKGCYPGQEIIARLHYRGTAKRRLCPATTDNKTPLQPGTALILAEENRNIGAVVNSTVTDQCQELLIVLERSFSEAGKVVAKDFPDCPIKPGPACTANGL